MDEWAASVAEHRHRGDPPRQCAPRPSPPRRRALRKRASDLQLCLYPLKTVPFCFSASARFLLLPQYTRPIRPNKIPPAPPRHAHGQKRSRVPNRRPAADPEERASPADAPLPVRDATPEFHTTPHTTGLSSPTFRQASQTIPGRSLHTLYSPFQGQENSLRRQPRPLLFHQRDTAPNATPSDAQHPQCC